MKNFLWLTNLMRPAAFTITLGLILASLSIGSNIGLMAAAGWLITMAAFHPPLYELSLAIVGVRFFGIARACFRYGERYLSHDATFRVLSHLRVLYYKALLEMPQRQFDEQRRGALLERMVGDIEVLQYFYLRVLAPVAIAVIILGLSGFYLLIAAGPLFWVLFALLLAGAVFLPFGFYKWQQQKAKPVGELKEAIKSQLADSMAGCEEIAAFRLEKRYLDKTAALCRDLGEAQIKASKIAAILEGLSVFVLQLAGFLSLVFLVGILETQQLSGIDMVVLYLVVTSSLESAGPLFMLPQFWQSSISAAERLKLMIKEQPPAKDREFKVNDFSLSFRDVFVKYGDGEPALQGLELTVPYGRKVAIVGASGAGKTTLVKALLSLVDYTGSITLGGEELSEYPPEKIQEYISVVSQDTFLFSATIEENIRLARPSASPEEVAAAIKAAGAEAFISELPAKLETRVGQHGRSLSGGQRQRLALARAFLKNAPILVLDEPTAGLDALTAHAFMKEVLENSVQTVLLITHWLSDLSAADEILVLEQGSIIERGTEKELISKKGVFYQMREIQRNII